MKIRLQNGTGCAATVFDTDALAAIDVHIDFMMRTKCKVDFETMTIKLEE